MTTLWSREVYFFVLDPKVMWVSILILQTIHFGKLGNYCLLSRHQSIWTPWGHLGKRWVVHHHHAKQMCKKKINSQGNNHLLCSKGTQNSENDKSSTGWPSGRSRVTRSIVPPSCSLPWKYHWASLHTYTNGHIFSNCIWHENVLKTHHKVVSHIIHVWWSLSYLENIVAKHLCFP